MRHKNKNRLILFCIIFYCLMSQLILPALNLKAIYPFSQWNLYARIIGKQYSYEIFVEEYAGKKIDKCRLQNCPFGINNHRRASFLRKSNWMNNSELKIGHREFIHKAVTSSLLPPFTYSIVKTEFYPIEFFREGKFISRAEIYRERVMR